MSRKRDLMAMIGMKLLAYKASSDRVLPFIRKMKRRMSVDELQAEYSGLCSRTEDGMKEYLKANGLEVVP